MIDDKAFFESLVAKGSDAILSIDEESTIVFANESVERVFGYDPEELIGESLLTVMPDRFHEQHQTAIAEYLETGERGLDWNNIQLPGEHKEGHEIPLSITFEEHRYDDRRIFSGIIRDITEQKEYQRTLETLQETAQQLLRARERDEISEITVNAASEVLDFPLAAVYLYDATNDRLRPAARTDAVEIVFDDLTTLIGEDNPVRRAFDTGEATQYDDITAAADIDETGLPIEGMLLMPMGMNGVLVIGSTDATTFDEKQTNLAYLLAANAEAALNRAHREATLERQNQQLERFASIVSHDLRDPLNAANAQVALAQNEHDSEYLDELGAIHERMEEIIEDVLTLTKQGQTVGETTTVELATVIENAWAVTSAEAASLETDEHLGTVNADPERLRTLLENLFGNAIRHVGEDVTVRVGRLADRTGFYVEDDGPGIPEADQEQIFKYGYTTDDDGTGLGLNIVKEIGNAHGWSVRVTDGTDGGARFEFDFAARAAQVNE
ncbi:MAG: PAS domain S-box protein [Halobacteriales archaeon]